MNNEQLILRRILKSFYLYWKIDWINWEDNSEEMTEKCAKDIEQLLNE